MEVAVAAKAPSWLETISFLEQEAGVELTPFGLLPPTAEGWWKGFQTRQFLKANPDWRPPLLGGPIIVFGVGGLEPTLSPKTARVGEWWAAAGNEVRVTRWMSQLEANAMKESGTLQVGTDGVTYVTAVGAPKPSGTGPVRVDFNVPRGALLPAGNAQWYPIRFPARPPVTGIVVH